MAECRAHLEQVGIVSRSFVLFDCTLSDSTHITRSTAEVTAFCFELAKKLDMKYSAPPMPVNIHMAGGDPTSGSVNDASINVDSIGTDLAPPAQDTTLPMDVKELADMFN